MYMIYVAGGVVLGTALWDMGLSSRRQKRHAFKLTLFHKGFISEALEHTPSPDKRLLIPSRLR